MHLPVIFILSDVALFQATDSDARSLHYQSLIEQLGNALGNEYFQLCEQFHHVLWIGDLNYRLARVSSERVLEAIERNVGEW